MTAWNDTVWSRPLLAKYWITMIRQNHDNVDQRGMIATWYLLGYNLVPPRGKMTLWITQQSPGWRAGHRKRTGYIWMIQLDFHNLDWSAEGWNTILTHEIGLETHAVLTAVYITRPWMRKNKHLPGLKMIKRTGTFWNVMKRWKNSRRTEDR
jgi:hypothetical protein